LQKARADVVLNATVAELVPVTRREMGTFEFLFHDQRSYFDGGAYTIENSCFAIIQAASCWGPSLPAIRPTAVAGSFYSADAAETFWLSY
jgi:hypothetical protein